ncbi:MAG: hypothetical protein PHF31_02535 [Methylobacter sp.]|nr:hypothetical protein [Methylobacter sp.]
MLFNNLSTLILANTQNNADAELFFKQFKENLEHFDKPGTFPAVNETELAQVIILADEQGYLGELGIDKETATMLAHSIVVDHKLPQALLENAKIRYALENAAVKKAGQQSPLRPDEAEAVVGLIHSGELFTDLVYTLTRIFKLILGELGNIRTVPSIIPDLIEIPAAIVSDLINVWDFLRRLDQLIELIKSGKQAKNPEILNNTLKTIFQIAIIGDAIDTANSLFSEENQSLRIALLIYARLHKINLEEADIDAVRVTILNKDNPQLGVLLIYVLKNSSRLMGK